MEIVRNSVRISGIAGADEFPADLTGLIVQYSETETVHIPENHPGIHNIFEVWVQVELKPGRTIHTPLGRLLVMDGIRKLKITYSESGETGRAVFLDLETPYNTYLELPFNATLAGNAGVYVLDAYFSLLDTKRIYSHTTYMIHAKFSPEDPIY